jgi:hypothetical protein
VRLRTGERAPAGGKRRPATAVRRLAALAIVAALLLPAVASAQECPKPDPAAQKWQEQECLAAKNEWD